MKKIYWFANAWNGKKWKDYQFKKNIIADNIKEAKNILHQRGKTEPINKLGMVRLIPSVVD